MMTYVGIAARYDLGCVKTCAREEAAELFSSLASPDGVHQRVYFSNRQN
jgi:hypothetical protein